MRWFEVAMTVALAALGARSLVLWLRRPVAGRDAADHLLFATFVVGRVGLWWSLAGLFAIYDSVSGRLSGRAFTDEIRDRFWWYPVIVLALTSVQFVAGFLLARRGGSPEAG